MKSILAYRHEQFEPRSLRDALPCTFGWLIAGNDC
jgi:hypothetical protein